MVNARLEQVFCALKNRDPNQAEFQQAVFEMLHSLKPFLEKNPKYLEHSLLERMIEPERTIMFRVPWVDDQGHVQVNRGFRIQMSSALGPYKGGLRFHPSVNLSILKFLAFEQVFKNALTRLPMGGGKGGSDFNPKGKSDGEVMRFCQSFMTELYRHIGADVDVPAGDIGVGGREIGYLFGQYKRITNQVTSTMTGKSMSLGGSLIRPEATGYGLVYFVTHMLARKNLTMEGLKVSISGSGNVAQYAAEKVIALGGKVLTLSDSNGYVLFDNGMTAEQLAAVIEHKEVKRGRMSEFAAEHGLPFFENQTPWSVAVDIALPSATQNEIRLNDAKTLVANGCICIAEGSNMSADLEATDYLLETDVLYAPGKATNAGGVSVSGLEMSQNAMRLTWTAEEVDQRLCDIMENIHATCLEYGTVDGRVNYLNGANIAGFKRVADAMLASGIV